MNDFNKHLVITGTARSGTSWLSETLAQQHRYRMLFEPEHETQTAKGHLLCDKWLTNPNQAPESYAYLKQVLKNRVDCDWIAQNSNRTLKRHLWPFIPKKFIIKFVRANLLASYLSEWFGVPVVFMLRNPYDVVFSQQQVKFPWLYDLTRFSSQENLVDVVMSNFGFDIRSHKKLSDLETLTLRWCIENVLPLEVFNVASMKVDVVRYEELFGDIQVFFDLCRRFDLKPVDTIESIYKKPSSKTHPSKHTLAEKKVVKKWGEDELKQINGILDIFKTQLYERTY